MIFYLTSDVNQDKLDYLKDIHILNKDLKTEFNPEAFMKYIKKDIRNIQIDFFIIDMSIFEVDKYSELCASFDAFFLLNPDSKILIIPDEQKDIINLNEVLGQDGLFIIENVNNLENEIFNIINNINVPVEEIEIPETAVIVDIDSTRDSIIENENAIEDCNELKQVTIQAETIYDKASNPVKLSAGKPLNSQKTRKVKNNLQSTDEVKEEDKDVPGKPGESKFMNLKEYINIMKEPTQKTDQWNCKNIMIGIIGAERKVGATTAAFHLASYLRDQGANVAYTEANLHNHLVDIAQYYDFVQSENHFIKGSISYYTDNKFDIDAGNNFIIFDLGCITENTEWVLKIVKEVMNNVFIISGCKPYEQKELVHAIDKIKDRKINILFNLLSMSELEKLKEKYQSEVNNISFISYEPSLINSGRWEENFLKLFNEYKQDKQVIKK